MKALLASSALMVFALSMPAAAWASSAPTSESWGVDTASFSQSVRPGDDFYRYVNEGWLKTAKPPEGVPFIDALVEVYLATEQRIGGIITESRETTDAPGSPEQLIGDFHRSHSDMERRNALA